MYLRISKEDFKEGESQSLSGQRNLLQAFIQKEQVSFSDKIQIMEFSDDGYSGVNEERPALKRLLSLVNEEQIDCILVKDFSRLARDYLLLGEYMEILFPIHKVRFISVNDGYDSQQYPEHIPEMDMQFRGLCYDLYSKDISHKVKSALRAKKRAGIYISANTPFGYEKSSYDRHKIKIKEEEAEVVRKIFQLAEEGYGVTEIARKLRKMQIKTPKEFRESKSNNKKYYWHPATVWRILKNRVYIGELIQGKYEKQYVGGRNRKTLPEQWMIQKNHHEKIVTVELFDKVQELTKKKLKRG